jgi:hypothetical protein
VVVELGARQAELGRQPRRARKFFIDYQDRILFGTDQRVSEEMYRNHFRWLETPDEYFDYWGSPRQGRWKIYGLDLPDPVLRKIYYQNAENIFSQFKGLSIPGKSRASLGISPRMDPVPRLGAKLIRLPGCVQYGPCGFESRPIPFVEGYSGALRSAR